MTSRLAHKVVDTLNDHRIAAGIDGTLNQPERCAVTVWGKPADTVDGVIELVKVSAASFPDLGEIIRKLENLKSDR